MIGGSQSILLIGGIICICYICISVGAGLYYYNQGGSLQKLKDKVIKKKKARSAVALICTGGNVIYNGKCQKEFTDQECRDDNDVFWKADPEKKKTECIEIDDDKKGMEVCRSEIGDMFSSYNKNVRKCLKLVKGKVYNDKKEEKVLENGTIIDENGNVKLNDGTSLNSCDICINCNDINETNTIYTKIPDENTGYTSCRNRNDIEKKDFCLNMNRFFTSDNKCILDITKLKPILEVDTVEYNKVNLIIITESFIDVTNIVYKIEEALDNNASTIEPIIRSDQKKVPYKKVLQSGNKKLFYFSTKSGGLIKKNSKYNIVAKILTNTKGSHKTLDKTTNESKIINNARYDSNFSNKVNIQTPCRKITDNHCRNSCNGLFCGPVNDYELEVKEERRDKSLTEEMIINGLILRRQSRNKCDCINLTEEDRFNECVKRLNAPKKDIEPLKDSNGLWTGCKLKIKPSRPVNYLTAEPLYINQDENGNRLTNRNEWITNTSSDTSNYYRVLIKWKRPSVVNNNVGILSLPHTYVVDYKIVQNFK